MSDYYKGILDFRDKKAVITGGAGLLGREIAKCFASFGAYTIIADNDEEDSLKIQKKIQSKNELADFHFFDLSDVETIPATIEEIETQYGPVDVWVNNAYPRTIDWGDSLEELSIESWRKNVDMHLNGYCICSNEIAKRMAKRGGGSIINMGSIQSFVAPEFSIYQGTNITSPAAYTAIKGGILTYSKYLASYYGKDNVRVNVVCPGGIANNQSTAFVDAYNKKTLLGRMAEAKEIAPSVVFLASGAGSYITGTSLIVDGGLTAI